MVRFSTRASALAIAASILSSAAGAQSTSTTEFEQGEIVVTGARATGGVDGIVTPDTPKAKAELTQQFIQHQTPGQSIDEIINQLPGVSFQNNDPYGSSGGTLTIHGFDASRISQTWDGIPLNDTGNYAIYSNQQFDPELIGQVTVNLGTTDLDSPTASATGSTVNYTTRLPTEDFHARVLGSTGDWNYFRLFGVIDTGTFTPFGTRAFMAASHEENENPFNHASRTNKYQYNARVYQPLGANGDFLSIAGHYNRNRNSNFSSIPLRTDPTIITPVAGGTISTAPRVVGSGSSNRFPTSKDEREYSLGHCSTDEAQAGVADVPNSCGTQYDYSYNPSDTWNIRGQSRFTIANGLVLTVEPSYQNVKANGGNGAVHANEGFYSKATGAGTSTGPLTGYIGGQAYFGGVDLNGDGDTLDTPTIGADGALTNTSQGVELYAPSHTETHRWIVLSSLLYTLNEANTFRVSYTFDHGHHRQTGPLAYLNGDGHSTQYFPIDDPILDADGNIMQKRNRRSLAILNQVSGEYRGTFLDDRLVIDAGVRAPFFQRKLNNFCVTEAGGSGYVDCFNGEPDSQAAFLAANPTYAAPQKRGFKYHKVLPTAGLTFKIAGPVSVFGNYSKGIQVPGTDNLYNSFGFAEGTDGAKPSPETTDNFEGGVRYKSGKVQAEVSGWYTLYKNRLASAYDPILDVTIYRNLGKVHKYGVDSSVAYQPVKPITLYAFGSYLKSKILDNVQTGGTVDDPVYAMTAGKRESGFPTYTFGGRAEGNFGPFEVGAQVKRTGPRYVNDQNLPVTQSYTLLNADGSKGSAVSYQVYGAKTPAYTVLDLDARVSMAWAGLGDSTYLQVNVTNLFDKLYVAGFSGNLPTTSVPYAYIGAPRTVSGTINFAF